MKTSELKQSLTPCDYGPASGIWALLYQVSFHIRGRRSHPNFRIADDQGERMVAGKKPECGQFYG